MKKAALPLIISLSVAAAFPVSAAPPVLKAENISSTENRLSWTKTEGASSYIILSKDPENGKYKRIGRTKTLSCRDKELSPASLYIYKVVPEFPDGTKGETSAPAEVFTRNKYGSASNIILRSGSAPCCGTVQGEWIYYTYGTWEGFFPRSDEGCLCRVKTDGSGFQVLNPRLYADSLNASGDRLYYIINGANESSVVSCRLDGSGEKVITSSAELGTDDPTFEFITVTDNRILLFTESMENLHGPDYRIYSIDPSGKLPPQTVTEWSDYTDDDLSGEYEPETEQEKKESREREAKRVMTEACFTSPIFECIYKYSRLPEVKNEITPEEHWLYYYPGSLYLCTAEGYKAIYKEGDPFEEAIITGDKVFFTVLGKDMKRLYMYSEGKKKCIYKTADNIYILHGNNDRVFFLRFPENGAPQVCAADPGSKKVKVINAHSTKMHK